MKTFKKLFTVLAIILFAIISLLPARSLSAENDLTITVTGDVKGRTLSVYQLFDLTVTGTAEKPVYNYTWAGASEKFFSDKKYETVAKATDYLKGLENNSTALTTIAEEYYQYCKDNGQTAIAKKQGIDTTEAVFTVPGQGYYLVYDETEINETGRARAAAMLSNVTKNAEVALKAEKTTVEKMADKATAAVGETVNYTVTSRVPNVVGYDSYKFIVTDTLSKGLTLTDNTVVTVTIGGETYTAWTKNVTPNDGGTTTLTITFNPTEFAKLKDKTGAEIKITYSAVLNNDAATILDNTNEVKIEYSNNPTTDGTGTTNTDVVHVYTYKIDFTKKNTAGVALPGAKFVLKLSDGKFATFDEKGVFTGTVATKEEATVLTSDDNGNIAISGLKAGTYTLIETEAPSGYSVPNFEFIFTISQSLDENGKLKTATFDYKTDENLKAAKGYMTDKTNTSASFAIEVLNAKEGSLPTTGGIGTTIFTVAGIAVMAVAVVALVAHNKKND